MTNDILLRDVIASDLPIFFEQQLDPVANGQISNSGAYPNEDRLE